ncbi:hypothetical protein DPMN_100471 [Dreissena polymorpha]|uniref:Uncharacterized protein n=1 Tax=Dreissena polymorpha TaxID=45954 RepID=A0A9D4LH43_DREPO|nr:hypothetical protein DPMN_100471 [Dreissena polymorpha]
MESIVFHIQIRVHQSMGSSCSVQHASISAIVLEVYSVMKPMANAPTAVMEVGSELDANTVNYLYMTIN